MDKYKIERNHPIVLIAQRATLNIGEDDGNILNCHSAGTSGNQESRNNSARSRNADIVTYPKSLDSVTKKSAFLEPVLHFSNRQMTFSMLSRVKNALEEASYAIHSSKLNAVQNMFKDSKFNADISQH